MKREKLWLLNSTRKLVLKMKKACKPSQSESRRVKSQWQERQNLCVRTNSGFRWIEWLKLPWGTSCLVSRPSAVVKQGRIQECRWGIWFPATNGSFRKAPSDKSAPGWAMEHFAAEQCCGEHHGYMYVVVNEIANNIWYFMYEHTRYTPVSSPQMLPGIGSTGRSYHS